MTYKFERLYRTLFNEEMYYLAYERIYAKPGNMTKGVDGKTIDGFSISKVKQLIDTLKDETYHPYPSKRTYIPKKNGKKRPLGIAAFYDKLLQEAIRLILEAIYETIFEKPSYRTPIKSRRCLIPSTGFYEYHHNDDKTTALYKIILPDEEIFSIAGIYDCWAHPYTGEIFNTFSLLTTTANPLMREIHNGGKNPYRMPVIIPQDREDEWLKPKLSNDEIKAFFNPFDEKLMFAEEVDKKIIA